MGCLKRAEKMCCPTFQPWEHAISYGPDLILIENHSEKNVSFRSLRGPAPARLNTRKPGYDFGFKYQIFKT